MAQRSKIEWTEVTWNPVAGCTPVSPGCHNCYAARLALRLSAIGNVTKYGGTARTTESGRPVFTGKITLDPASLEAPRRWRQPRLVFVNSMSDLFHESVPADFIRQVVRVIEESPRHTFQILTKRPERALSMVCDLPWPTNLWMGVSVESRKYFSRVRTLQQIPASIRFLSCEPLLESLPRLPLMGIHWVIVGGESGPGARPMRVEWVEGIQAQCQARSIPFFFKQWGGTNKAKAGRTLRGTTWNGMPSVAASAA